MSTFLEVRDLRTHFLILKGLVLPKKVGAVKAFDGITLEMRKG